MTSETVDPLADEIDVEVAVQGARGAFERDALVETLAEVADEHEVALQAFDPSAVYGAAHLEAAARRAVRSHEQDRAIARNLPVEVACYAAGVDQIDDALARVGVPESGDALVLCGVGAGARSAVEDALEEMDLRPDDDVLGHPLEALETLGVTSSMREQVDEEEWPKLAVEQVALLDARR